MIGSVCRVATKPVKLLVVPQATKRHDFMSELAATFFAKQLRKKQQSVLGLASGSTPKRTYGRLVESALMGEIDLSHATFFNLDEYVDISPRHFELTYRYFMERQFFAPLAVLPDR